MKHSSGLYIISAIDTGVGKTYATGTMLKWLRKRGHSAISHKIVQTGNKGISEDIVQHRHLAEMPLQREDHEGQTCSGLYAFPASPHLAARLEGSTISQGKIVEDISFLQSRYKIVLSEGAGGLLVPLQTDTTLYTIADLILELNAPVVLVTSSRLGSINHTLLSLYYCLHRGITVAGIIYNLFPETSPQIASDSLNVIQQFLSQNLPYVPTITLDPITQDQADRLPDFSPLFNCSPMKIRK